MICEWTKGLSEADTSQGNLYDGLVIVEVLTLHDIILTSIWR